MIKTIAAVLLACTLALPAAAQSGDLGGPFSLQGTGGNPGSSSAYAGKYMIIMFGYGNCAELCTGSIKAMTDGVAKMDAAKAAKVVPMMITVDPEADTPARLRSFTASISPRLVGLTGTRAAIDDVLKRYYVSASRVTIPLDASVDKNQLPASMRLGYMYSVPDIIYVMGPQGSFYTMLYASNGADTLAKQLNAVIK